MDPFNGVRANKAMAAYCFHVLEGKLKQWRAGAPLEEEVPNTFNVHGLFVTYEKTDGNLRGCIGTFSQGNLKSTLEQYSLIAALKDNRFPRVGVEELPGLMCSVTVLSAMSAIPQWDEWTPGKHGIYITLNKGQQKYSATFLPTVITDQGWSKVQTFEHLLLKSGYRGTPSRELFQQCEVMTYEGSKDVVSYDEYHNGYKERWGFLPLD